MHNVKKSIAIFLSWLIFLSLSGCIVQSLNPFYTEESLIDTPESILGKWKLVKSPFVGDDDVLPWRFETDEVITFDKNNNEAILTVRYFKIDENIYASFFPDEPDNKLNTYWVACIQPVHTCCKVEISKNQLVFEPINLNYIIKLIEKGEKIPYFKPENDEDQNIIFTASSDQWFSLLKKYNNDQKLFSEEDKFLLKRE